MSNTINYAEQYTNQLRELYGQESKADALYHSNSDIQLRGGKTIKIPTLSVSGYRTTQEHRSASLRVHTRTTTKQRRSITTVLSSS